MRKKARNIGLEVPAPKSACEDENCPFHGSLPVRGRALEGVVVSAKAPKTVVVERSYLHYIQKYERYERRRSRIPAHNPPCIAAEEGDRVKIVETRPLSKTKHFVVVQVIEKASG